MNGYKLKMPIRHNGVRYKKDEFIPEIELDEQSAKRLLFLNVISKAVQDDEKLVEVVQPIDVNSQDKVTDTSEESVEEVLDLNFEWDELKEEAKVLGLEWKGNISKENLIKLIVKNELQSHFLDQLED